MGGEDIDDARREWDLHPEKPAILTGTQDMLLSRALSGTLGDIHRAKAADREHRANPSASDRQHKKGR